MISRRQLLWAAPVAATAQVRKTPPTRPAPAWTVWGGPGRDFRVSSAGLAAKWPAGGPPKVWSRTLGEDGYSGISVENNILYSGFRRGPNEVFTALSAADGKTIWEHSTPAPFRNAYQDRVGPGPYAMPQLIGNLAFVAGATGIVHALDKKTGKVIWKHDLYREFGATRMEYGYSCHGLPYRDTIIYLAGGLDKAIISFRQADGGVVYARHTFSNAHSSPLLIQVGGLEQVAILHATEALAINPINGDIQWRHPHKTDYGLAIATPVWNGKDLLLVSSAYNTGSRMLELTRTGDRTSVKEAWRDQKLQIQFGTVVSQGEHLIGSSGHRGPAFLTMFEWRTGRLAWQNRDFAKAHVIAADGKLILLDEDGNLALASATPQALTVHSKASVLTSLSWTPPTLAGSRLYARDRHNLTVFELGA